MSSGAALRPAAFGNAVTFQDRFKKQIVHLAFKPAGMSACSLHILLDSGLADLGGECVPSQDTSRLEL